MCTADATLDSANAFCEPDAWALFVVGAGYQCFAKCDRPQFSAGSGASGRTWRAGYACQEYATLDDGGLSDGSCQPTCRSDLDCSLASDGGSAPCNTATGLCQTECTSSADCRQFNGAKTFAACMAGHCQF